MDRNEYDQNARVEIKGRACVKDVVELILLQNLVECAGRGNVRYDGELELAAVHGVLELRAEEIGL